MKFCTHAADFELDERHVIKNEKVTLDRLPSSTERISCLIMKCLDTTLYCIETTIDIFFKDLLNHITLQHRLTF